MTSYNRAKMTYGTGISPVQTDRGLEFEALAKITQQLRAGMSGGANDFPKLCAAIHSNRQIWNLWAADVADSANGLSDELRSKIFYLAEFVNKHSRDILKGSENSDTLVDINLAVLRGLSPTDTL